nr:MAG TPA: hypothetical protein [Caudoviricetes sp.]DAM12556.1 MAG TPA: hypothetical protein [Caudoviricetes sp.]DAV65577.1 MAG TPA: hypothetical protein [Caudoviricetes sp.]
MQCLLTPKDNSLLHVLIVLLSGANLVPLFYC